MLWKSLVAVALLGGCAEPALAGLYTDDLSRCLVENTSAADKITLVQWIVVAISQHPAVSSLNKATDADIDKTNAAVGALLMRLLTDTCVEKSKKAIQYEGAAAIQSSFMVLGQVAAADLFADSSVKKVMAGLGKYVDEKKLQALKDPAP
jgi:hypothetical protein